MKNVKTYVIIAISGILVGRFILQPEPKTVTKEVIVYREKKQEKKDTKKVVTSVKTKKPDGTVVTQTTVKEDTKQQTNTETKLDSKTVTKKGSGITLGLLAVKSIDDMRQTDLEAVGIIPIFGNLKGMTSINTKKQIGVGLGLEF